MQIPLKAVVLKPGLSAAHLEGSAPVPGYEHLSATETFRLTTEAAKDLRIKEQLQAYAIAGDSISADKRRASYHLIVLDLDKMTVLIKPFSLAQLDEASRHYADIEQMIESGQPYQAVLVSAGPVTELRRAYPNFFLDTRQFILYLNQIEKKANA